MAVGQKAVSSSPELAGSRTHLEQTKDGSPSLEVDDTAVLPPTSGQAGGLRAQMSASSLQSEETRARQGATHSRYT